MKIKITSTYAIAATALALLVSSCGSNVTVAKRYHSGGFNFSWGGGSDADKAVAKTSTKKPVTKKIGKASAADWADEQAADVVEAQNTASTYAQAALKATQTSVAIANSSEVATVLASRSSVASAQQEVIKASAVAKQSVQAKKASSGPGKSQIVALVLAILVGVIGVHRFYLGYPMEGILQLLTAGGCGIWTLIDIVRIITGDLQPADGEYEETL